MAESTRKLEGDVRRFTRIGRLIGIGQLCPIGRFPNQQVEGSIPSWRASESRGKTAGSASLASRPGANSASDLRNACVNSVRLGPFL